MPIARAHRAGRPLGRVGGLLFEGPDDHRLHLIVADYERDAPGLVKEAVEPRCHEPAAPRADGRRSHPELLGHRDIRGARGPREDDAGPQRHRHPGMGIRRSECTVEVLAVRPLSGMSVPRQRVAHGSLHGAIVIIGKRSVVDQNRHPLDLP